MTRVPPVFGDNGWGDPVAQTRVMHGAGAGNDDGGGWDRITLGGAYFDAGGDPDIPLPAHEFEVAELGWFSRRLLRMIGVDTDCVPAGEQWKLCLMACTVLLNGGLAAAFTPIGLTVAYGHLSLPGIVIAALVGGCTIGLIDALVVGQWHSYGRRLTSINPDAAMPRMPGTPHRIVALAPRLLVTAGIVFTLGLMLTLAVNQSAVRQEMGTQDAQHNKTTRTSLLAPYVADINAKQAAIPGYLAANAADLANVTKYQKLASCESLGFPIVPGCSGHVGPGRLYRTYLKDATAAQSDANQQMQNVTNARTAIANDQKAERSVENSPQFKQAMIPSTGIIAATSAYNGYVTANHIPWWDAWRMDLLLLVLDVTPLLIKLGSGTSQYEAEQWWRAHQRALAAYHGDRRWQQGVAANSKLHAGVAEAWVDAGVKKAKKRFADQLAQPAQPGPPTGTGGAPARERPGTTRVQRPPTTRLQRPSAALRMDGLATAGAESAPRGEDPFNLGRNAGPGDVMHLSGGDYLLLTRLTGENARNSDVFIAVELPKPGQRTPNSRDGSAGSASPYASPVRALKLTKLDAETGAAVPISAAERALLDHFPDDPALLKPGSLTQNHDGRIAYTMPYLPCGDLERYAYGTGPGRPRLTCGQAIEVGLTVARGLRPFWELGLSHNDARPRNVLLAGPFQGDGDPLSRLAPGRHGQAVLTDYNFVGYLDDVYRDPPGLVVNALDGDPHVVRWMLEYGDRSGAPSPLGVPTDCYAPYAIVYSLLTGGLSPTTALLIASGWSTRAIQEFDTATRTDTWRELLAADPGLLLRDPPSLAQFGVDPAVAWIVDAGVRADPVLRQPQIAGAGEIGAAAAAGYLRDALSFARDRANPEWLRQPIPAMDAGHPWRGYFEAPVGYPREVLDALARYWPDYVRGAAA